MADQSQLNRLSQLAGTQNTQQGTGYTNLNRLTQANQGNKLGQTVAGNVQSQIGNVQNQLGSQVNQFQTESDKNKVGTDADITNRDQVIGQFAPSSSGNIGSGRSDSTKTAPSEQDISSFQKYTSGNYAGPKGLADTSGLQNTANQLRQQVSNFSPSGTQELLRRSISGGGRYTQGQQGLDTLLMDKSALVPVQRQASVLGQDINRANLAASGQAELNKNLAQKFGQETQSKLQAGLTGIDTSVQDSLKSAQAAEAGRQSQLQTLMNTLQGDVIPKLDANGKPVLDANGNPITERKLTGTTDPYARMDEISKALQGQGLVNQNQYEALFGQGGFTANKGKYDTGLADIRKQEVLNSINNSVSGATTNMGTYGDNPYGQLGGGLGTQLFNAVGGGRGGYMPGTYNSSDVYGTAQKNLNKVQGYMAKNNIDSSNPAAYNTALGELYKSGEISEADITGMKGNFKNSYDKYNFNRPDASIGGVDTTKDADRAAALESFKTSTGLAGRSTLDNKQDDFYKTLASSLGAASTGAQNLTDTGVASVSQRSNYEALNKLLGKSTSESKYRIDDPIKYKAGGINLDAAQIKRSLGY